MFLKLLYIFSILLTVGSAIMAALTRNILHSCVFLLGSLLGTAGLYLSLSADFVAGVQILVYVGGVTILMLFAVMLTGGESINKDKKLAMTYKTPLMGSIKSYLYAAVVGIMFLMTTGGIIGRYFSHGSSLNDEPWKSTVEGVGTLLITDYVLLFEMASILLLAAFVGAAVIARPSRIDGHNE